MCQFDECGKATGRREFMAGAIATGAAALVPSSPPARPAGRQIRVPTPVGAIAAYLAAPSARGRRPAVLVMHGQLGLPDWTCRVADELAGAGFVALAAARFSRTPEVTEAVLREDGRGPRRFLTETRFQEELQEVLGAVAYLRRLAAVRRSPIGAVGFCGGGIRAVRLSLATAGVGAVISFYGPPALPAQYKHPTDPIVDLVDIAARVRAPLQIHYGTSDYAVRADAVERLASEARRAGTPVETYAYEGATHGFYDAANASPANSAAAAAARGRYLAFLRDRLALRRSEPTKSEPAPPAPDRAAGRAAR
jgi:carboxymethylenebutenolidase